MTGGDHFKVLHASCVAFGTQGVLIIGASGTGKSRLALDLMALGGGLIADDRTELRNRQGVLVASAPKALIGKIEARGVGILAAEYCGPALIRLVVDLGAKPAGRLPKPQQTSILGVAIELINGATLDNLAPIIWQMLKGARTA